MSLQTTVFIQPGFGVPGDRYDNGPWRAQPFTLDSASEVNNIFGHAFTVKSEGIAQVGNPLAPGTPAVFAGILVNPRNHALRGVVGNTLGPSLTLPNGSIVELVTMGSVVVTLPAAAAIGDWVVYDNVTGALETVARAASLPSGKSWARAIVDRFTVSGAGLAVIKLTDATTPVSP